MAEAPYVPLRPITLKQRNYIVSNAKIEKTGFKTQVGLMDGIRELKKGFQILKRSQYGNA